MDNGIYITANSADNLMLAMQTNNHNLANANTIGFKADIEIFKTLDSSAGGLDTRINTEHKDSSADFRPGPIIPTGRDLDVAIKNDGWFVVDVGDGVEAYTRRGDFVISPEGLLTTANNLPILGNGGPISIPPSNKIEIGVDGTISVQPIGQELDSLVAIDRLKLVNPELSELKKGTNGLFYYTGEKQVNVDSNIMVTSGSLENSNVNTVEALVNMLDLTRQYEIQMKLAQSLEQNDTSSAQIMQIE